MNHWNMQMLVDALQAMGAATPVADVLSILIAAILFGKTMKKMQII